MSIDSKKAWRSSIFILVLTVLVIQLVNRYYASDFQRLLFAFFSIPEWASESLEISLQHFRILNFSTRFVIPIVLLIFLFRIPFRDWGLGLPQMRPLFWWLSALAFLLIPFFVALAQQDPRYTEYYLSTYANASIPTSERILRFGLFTASTFFGWAFLHRSFLLFGAYYLLTNRWSVARALAGSLAIAFVAVFEVSLHFLKPDIESWALLVGSPLMSWMALRTKSLWIPTLCHLWVEVWFIGLMIWGNS